MHNYFTNNNLLNNCAFVAHSTNNTRCTVHVLKYYRVIFSVVVCILLGISPASDCDLPYVSEPSVSSIFKGWVWSTEWVVRGECDIYVPGPRVATSC
jgi:hypothetical protein